MRNLEQNIILKAMFNIRKPLYSIAFLICILFLMGCPPDSSQKIRKKFNNITVLLDLSDRILAPGQIDRDKVIINTVFKAFQSNIKKNLYFGSQDKFQVRIARQEKNPNTLKMGLTLDELYFDMETVPVQNKKKIKEVKITDYLDTLYDLAKYSEYYDDYKGADIVGFLRDDILSTQKDTSDFVNTLIIISDGYLYVDGAHKGSASWPAVADLKSFDIGFFELNPGDYKSGELKKMKNRLSVWLAKMNANQVILQHTTGISTVKNTINELISISNLEKLNLDAKKKDIKLENSPIIINKKIIKNKKAEVKKNSNTFKTTNLDLTLNRHEYINNTDLKKNVNSKEIHNLIHEIDPSLEIINNTDVEESIWYSDYDKDGLGDPYSIQKIAEGTKPLGNWVKNANDKCPTRKGDSNGCPILKLELPTDFNVSQQVRASLILGDLKNSDNVNWSIPNGIIKNDGSLSTIQLTGDIVGYYDIEATVNGTVDDYTDKITKRVHVKMNPDDLKQNYLLPILRKAYAKSGNFATTKSKIEARFNQHTNNKDIMVYDDADLELNPLSIFLTVDLTKKVIDINVLDITYDRKTGKISSIKIKLVKD